MELLLLEKPREARTRGLARAVARRAAAWYLVLVMDAAAALATNINQPINQSINQSKREREREREERSWILDRFPWRESVSRFDPREDSIESSNRERR
mmetsp:Transcript_14123/g.39992  ORF Transcript_14123/g.39992 Transcript_14123/m.39992 type:complete len:98 (+) Transcript_14123:2661-2954(+)